MGDSVNDIKKGKCTVWGRFAKENGTGGLTEYENSNEANGGVYHGMET